MLEGVIRQYDSKKGPQKVLENAFRNGSQRGSWNMPCSGFQRAKGSQKRFLALYEGALCLYEGVIEDRSIPFQRV